MHSRLQTAPGILFLAFFPGRRAWNRQHEKEKEQRADGVNNVNAGKTNVSDDEPANSRPSDGADLKDAVVPGDSVSKSVARNQCRKKGTTRGPAKRPGRPRNKEQKINQRDREIAQVK